MDISKDYDLFLEAIAGLMVIDKQGNVVYMNEQCADYINVDREKSLGKYVTEVFPSSNMQNLLTGQNKFNTNFYFQDGRMSVSTQTQLRKDGEIAGVLEYDMIQDIDALDDLLSKYGETLKDEMDYFREQVRNFKSTKYSIHNILGSSQKVKALKRQIELAAASNSTVLICGETGTGKELVAHSIHNLSARAFNNFVKVNAAGMAETLIESELFGYEEGAFTGAKRGGKKGKFQLADQGTLFIDEINQMPMSLQPKILRVLQEKEIAPIGSEKDIVVNVRMVVASNQDLRKLVGKGEFREDLYYRLNVFPINVPPLRERLEDIPELVEAKIADLNKELGKNISRVEANVYHKLAEYDWPGNIRELYNRVEAAMNYAQGEVLRMEHFNFRTDNSNLSLEELNQYGNPIEEVKKEAERKLINEVLMRFDYNKTQAAEYLKISRPLLYQKMKRLKIPL
ncbi:sigma 54-interacting transcriptional regulator [Anaerovorax odorimutans]|uniref:Sigma 54-interacting transcriptional regulator n=1 Tax=Anaerovorax odorimutans TaxID=109327 RepID=A0ABT1RJ36_9FIRM|nr:sigma 54-interacting transcriptional regulator [Anaerovorax odorimutans]MCQ4635193.1 sigma 54-interacting transcriptional regulator [Anaerovorax odorimutans]